MQYSSEQQAPMMVQPQPSQIQQDTYNPYGLQSQSPKIVELKLNNDDIIAEFEKFLRGVEWDAEKGVWVQIRKPLMNDKGIGFILTEIYAYCSKIVTLGKISEDEAKIRGKIAELNIAAVLFERYDEFDISEAFYGTIVNTTGDLMYISLTRAINGAENRAISEHTQTIEHYKDQAQQSGGIPSGLNPFKRRD